MKTASTQIDVSETEDFIEVDSFSASIAPVNTGERLAFTFRDRLCCIGFLAVFVAVMRLLVSN